MRTRVLVAISLSLAACTNDPPARTPGTPAPTPASTVGTESASLVGPPLFEACETKVRPDRGRMPPPRTHQADMDLLSVLPGESLCLETSLDSATGALRFTKLTPERSGTAHVASFSFGKIDGHPLLVVRHDETVPIGTRRDRVMLAPTRRGVLSLNASS